MNKPLNLFYAEPDPDRWFKYDRYPRKLIRKIVRGKPKPGGVMMVALNLMRGLDQLGVPYRFNEYKYIKQHPEEIVCIIGKPNLLAERKWKNPIIFGAGIFSHPCEAPELLKQYPTIKRVLVPGNWMQQMFEPFYGDKVIAWPTGIDTEYWAPKTKPVEKKTDFIIYDKIRWEREKYVPELLQTILKQLDHLSLSYVVIKYGSYKHADLKNVVDNAKAAVFLCEHETQGLAYQQILSANIPILAWDNAGYWRDPYYYPHKVRYQPVSSVPYWDERCGLKFENIESFEAQLKKFISMMAIFRPREYVLENLTLKICAQKYLDVYQQVEKELL